MSYKSLSRLVVAGMLCAVAAGAQRRVLVVDSQNRPGTHFTAIQPALDAADHGDIVVVRTGAYAQGFVTDKGVALLAEPGTHVDRPVRIEGVPAGATFTLQNVRIGGFQHEPKIQVGNCAGRVLLENVEALTSLVLFPNEYPTLAVEASTQVVLSRSRLLGIPAVSATNSTLLATDSECHGSNGSVGHGEFVAGAGVRATGSTVVLSRCSLRGGSMNGFRIEIPAHPALVSDGSSWTITGLAGQTIVAGSQPRAAVPAIGGTGTVTIHPALQLVPSGGGPPADPRIALVETPVPSLSAIGGPPGATVTVDLSSTPGDLVVAAVGFLGPPTVFPGLGALWLDPVRGFVVVGAGVQGPTGRFEFGVPTPRAPELSGREFTWQAITAAPTGQALLSNPATYVHGS